MEESAFFACQDTARVVGSPYIAQRSRMQAVLYFLPELPLERGSLCDRKRFEEGRTIGVQQHSLIEGI